VLLRADLEDMQTIRALVETEVPTKASRAGSRDAQLVGQIEGRPAKLLLEVHLADRCCVDDLSVAY
jgi:hypothetical protein